MTYSYNKIYSTLKENDEDHRTHGGILIWYCYIKQVNLRILTNVWFQQS